MVLHDGVAARSRVYTRVFLNGNAFKVGCIGNASLKGSRELIR